MLWFTLYDHFMSLVYTSATIGEINFMSNHSDAIELGHSASYHCSVNDSRVGISWYINNSNDIPSNMMTGVGSPSSTLTIPGLPEYNNTVVRCTASGYLDNNVPYINFIESTLRIQGI